jgi:hypothetical protein
MADSDRTLQVFIDILTREVGEKRAKEILAEASQGTADLRDETNRATDTTEQFNIKGRAQFLLFSEMNKILPGLGTALHAAFAGPLGPIILVGIAIAAAKNALDGYNKSLDEMGDAAVAGHAEAIQNLQTAWDDVNKSMAKYFADMHAKAEDDPTKVLIANLKQVLQLQYEIEKKQLELLGAPQDRKDALEDAHAAKTAALLELEKGQAIADMTNAQLALDRDKERKVLADARAKSQADELKDLQSGKPPGELVQAQKDLAGWQGNLSWDKVAVAMGLMSGSAIEYDQRQIDEAQQKVNQITALRERRISQLQSGKTATEIEQAEADTAFNNDISRGETARKRVNELSGPQGDLAQAALRESIAHSGRTGSAIIEEAKTLVDRNAKQFADIAATLKYYNAHAGSVNAEIAALRNELARHASELAQHAGQLGNLPH